MGVSEVRYLKKNIRENIKTISGNKIRNIEEVESLMRWCGWVYNDSKELLKEWGNRTR